MVKIVHFLLSNIMVVSAIGALLVFAPLMGIMIVHEQGNKGNKL